jgi:hypothetical protein
MSSNKNNQFNLAGPRAMAPAPSPAVPTTIKTAQLRIALTCRRPASCNVFRSRRCVPSISNLNGRKCYKCNNFEYSCHTNRNKSTWNPGRTRTNIGIHLDTNRRGHNIRSRQCSTVNRYNNCTRKIRSKGKARNRRRRSADLVAVRRCQRVPLPKAAEIGCAQKAPARDSSVQYSPPPRLSGAR